MPEAFSTRKPALKGEKGPSTAELVALSKTIKELRVSWLEKELARIGILIRGGAKIAIGVFLAKLVYPIALAELLTNPLKPIASYVLLYWVFKHLIVPGGKDLLDATTKPDEHFIAEVVKLKSMALMFKKTAEASAGLIGQRPPKRAKAVNA